MRAITVFVALTLAAGGRASAIPAGVISSEVPEAAIRALNEGRHLHASLIIREWLLTAKDTTPADLLLAARAEAGWSNWERVEQLLSGKAWLDTAGAGLGWSLLARSQYETRKWDASRNSFARFVDVAKEATAHQLGLAELYMGHAHREAGDNAAAIAAYDRASVLQPDVADWIALHAVAALAATGDTAGVAVRLVRIDAGIARD